MKSENLNFLEPCGPLQACAGLLYLFFMFHILHSHIRIDFHINRLTIANIILVIYCLVYQFKL